MTEEEARAWLAARWPQAACARLELYVDLLLAENGRQNLIARASEAVVWGRHIVDSAQLLTHAPDAASWLDIGSGPGLPGLVLAILADQPMTLVEPRARRVTFLRDATEMLGLGHVSVHQMTVEKLVPGPHRAITARAYAPLPQIFASAAHVADLSTVWILPKGRSAQSELEAARAAWQGVFHVKQSVTDDQAQIVVATQVRRTAR
ncbi:16S rRNA (guanine(527)-N(7))-methyltransferase RsmG [Sphingomonas changnyeongensis]|uniref:Ribosomal RNA small subunit methyltransferase G n=1 Tax=Sphingomonas changnyeongensis TaxID=2698679 RepID=A0A7Z2NUG8_9SPHN|nr:16S rRNA (guanine(527)-N(7))-methyltransferase RsmG [Sphingomonas changnyeongensis]QHL90038.1 16S rRNA (guanine(527)-N(7))-methyltransferase RsmG [Sphingomonas changnyeongensis]